MNETEARATAELLAEKAGTIKALALAGAARNQNYIRQQLTQAQALLQQLKNGFFRAGEQA